MYKNIHKRLTAVVAASGLLVLVGCAGMSSEPSVDELVRDAETQLKVAEASGGAWNTTQKLVDDAKKAQKENDTDKAVKAAKKAIKEAKLAQEQNKANTTTKVFYN